MSHFLKLAVFLLCASALGQTNSSVNLREVDIDGYAAAVNNRVITRGEVHQAMAPYLADLYRTYQGEELDAELKNAFRRARNELIEKALILEAFDKRGGMIPDQYVNDEIKRVISERFNGDKASFEQALVDQKITREEYMKTIREQMAVGMMINEEITKRARITPAQVREAYEENREAYFIPEKVQHSVIVFNKGETEEEQAIKRREAETVRQRLLDGADFAETAREVSEGSRSTEGGSFPWMQPKDVRPELQELLETIPAGELSEVIETESQFVIVKVDARRQSGYKSFEEVRELIKTDLTNKERERLRLRWIDRLKKDSFIAIYE